MTKYLYWDYDEEENEGLPRFEKIIRLPKLKGVYIEKSRSVNFGERSEERNDEQASLFGEEIKRLRA